MGFGDLVGQRLSNPEIAARMFVSPPASSSRLPSTPGVVHASELDKVLWLLVRRLPLLVRPQTVLGWHRRRWHLFWRWRCGRSLGTSTAEHRGPRAGCNDGAHRSIRGELLKRGIAVSAGSIRRYRHRGPARPPSQDWCTFEQDAITA